MLLLGFRSCRSAEEKKRKEDAMKKYGLKMIAIVLATYILGVAINAYATPAVDFSSVTTDFTNGSWSIGFEFNVLTPITVTQLGFYDDLKNGFTQSHEVGIFNANANLLVSTTVTNSDPIIGFFRWHDISPIVLQVGNDYRIAGVTGSENYTWEPNGLIIVSQIAFIQSRETKSSTLVYPTNLDVHYGIFGPNFQIETSQVPEPVTILLLGFGLVGLAGARRFRK
jgi:hypothetical protein